MEATLFEHVNLGGKTYHIRPATGYKMSPNAPEGFYWRYDLSDKGWNDIVSSVSVQSGWLAVYEHANMEGSCFVFEPGKRYDDLRSWGDRISSFVISDRRFDPQQLADIAQRLRGEVGVRS
ncbi:MAG TPA: beta/gamma crystallin-related protein [Symbiobacteriaceae bacterium]|nr:beta/gamma crystallin-related protein [Symbiobacteriaceae bacterium]